MESTVPSACGEILFIRIRSFFGHNVAVSIEYIRMNNEYIQYIHNYCVFTFSFHSNRTMLSFVLAQLLVQFKQPAIVTELKNNNNNESEDGAVSVMALQSKQSIHHAWNDAFSLAIMLVAISFVSILFQHHCYVGSNLLGVRLRIACSSMMYRKVI